MGNLCRTGYLRVTRGLPVRFKGRVRIGSMYGVLGTGGIVCTNPQICQLGYSNGLGSPTRLRVLARSTPCSSDYGQVIRNPVLFRLGRMVLWTGISSSPSVSLASDWLGNTRDTKGFAKYFTAQKLSEHCRARISRSYQNIVKKCDFGHNGDFKSRVLQETFYPWESWWPQ